MSATIEISPLDPKRFEALAGHSRSPGASYISRELEWLANSDESIIGVVLLDTVDDDYAAIVMTRDEVGAYRCFDLESSFETQDHASSWLIRAMRWHTGQGVRTQAQGVEHDGIDLFSPVVSVSRQHPYFNRLCNDDAYLPAKSIINEMLPHFVDVDGNYAEQFQSTGFDARLWELYLSAYLNEEELFLDRSYEAPDFNVTKYGQHVSIEAVTVGRKSDNPPKIFKTVESGLSPQEVLDKNLNEMPIRFGSPLYSKLQKEYWKLPHVSGNPLVFAVADFHDDRSMTWSSTALIHYLYGFKHDYHYDDSGKLVIEPQKIEMHKVGDKEVPSGYFFQPGAENISAILFSASGTISKFNRMGRQAGFKHPDVQMIRVGTRHDHDPNASMPVPYHYVVDESCSETWGEGLSMFHNPNAAFSIDEALFPTIAHHRFEDGQIASMFPEFYPYGSMTYHFRKGSE